MTEAEVAGIAAGLTKAQRDAATEGRVTDCPYNHPVGTRCLNCSHRPFKKGGAAEFVSAVRALIPSDTAKGGA